jgi:hypothetical protein
MLERFLVHPLDFELFPLASKHTCFNVYTFIISSQAYCPLDVQYVEKNTPELELTNKRTVFEAKDTTAINNHLISGI